MKYLTDVELELENLASKILKGMVVPTNYINIHTYFCQLELLNVSEEISLLLHTLQKKLVTDMGLLKESQLEKYFYGQNPEIIEILSSLKLEVDMWEPKYKQALLEKEDELVNDLADKMQGQDFVGMGEAINRIQTRKQELENIQQTKIQLQKFQGVVDFLIPLYGSSIKKLSKKTKNPSLNKEYQLYIQDMLSHIDQYAGNAQLAFVLGRSIKSIQELFPKTVILDPYTTEISENLLKVLTNPEDFYSDCKTNRILSNSEGTTFQYCYPAFYEIYLNIYLEDFEKMDYQDQITFRKCFSLIADNSQLLQLANTYIKLGYT